MFKVRRALISVSDKRGLIPFASGLRDQGVEILSTGGTCQQLREAGIPAIEVADKTGFPEIMGGRVKTLHPIIHGGLLGRTGRGALYVEHVWIADNHRRQGHGSSLLARAEREARARGCRFAHVETYSYHGPEFYERNGYEVFGRLDGYTGGYTRLYLHKRLAPESGA